MRGACTPRLSAALWLLAAALPVVGIVDVVNAAAGVPESKLSLTEATRQALDANLDLAARRRALEADREQIGIVRSVLLPQVTIGARGQLIDNDRSDSTRGNNRTESFLMAADLNQVVYDETAWADYSVQKHIYAQQVQEFDSFQLGVVQDAADAFLELDRARAVHDVQLRNREVTRKNLETSRARIAAGWSSDREVLRWESQLAANDSDVISAEVLMLQSRFELNRVRNLPPEETTAPLPVTIDAYGFVYARAAVAEAIASPATDRKLRDYLVRVGISRSPDLAALDASIAAVERQLTASERSFFVPSVSVAAGIDHLINNGNASGADFNETEWGLQGLITFPLVEGGAKIASLRQAREALASVRTNRRATALSLEQSIRAALAQASGSFAQIDFVRRQVAAARRNYELVEASYVLGVDSIIDLLDGQNQLLTADLAAANAHYGFLEDLIAAERQIALFPFLETVGDMESLVDDIAQALAVRP
jgi:outer membrane protein